MCQYLSDFNKIIYNITVVHHILVEREKEKAEETELKLIVILALRKGYTWQKFQNTAGE